VYDSLFGGNSNTLGKGQSEVRAKLPEAHKFQRLARNAKASSIKLSNLPFGAAFFCSFSAKPNR